MYDLNRRTITVHGKPHYMWLDGSDRPMSPVVVCCHGSFQTLHGRDREKYRNFVHHTRRFRGMRDDYLFVYPKSFGNVWREKYDRAFVEHLVGVFCEAGRDVYVAGFSGGGWPIHWLIETANDQIKGAIIHSGPAPRGQLLHRSNGCPVLVVVCEHEHLPWRIVRWIPISLLAGPQNNQWAKENVCVYRDAGHPVAHMVACDCECHRWWHEGNRDMFDQLKSLGR